VSFVINSNFRSR